MRVSHLLRRIFCVGVGTFAMAMSAVAAGQPALGGRWVPIDADRAAKLFDIGVSDVTSSGLTLSQNGDQISLTREGMPARQFPIIARSSSYTIGSGTAWWEGDKLVLITTFSAGQSRSILSMENDVLTIDTSAVATNGNTSHIVQAYRRAS